MELEKEIIRKDWIEKRKELGQLEREKRMHQITNLLFSRLMIHRYSPIHIFLPTPEEPNTFEIINKLEQDFSADIFVPKIQENYELSHIKFNSNTHLNKHKWGLLEPVGKGFNSKEFFEVFSNEDILILVPLIVFTKEGNRIGYGKGFYDRFLSHATKKTINVGLSFFDPISTEVKFEPTDVKLNYCISPKKVWCF